MTSDSEITSLFHTESENLVSIVNSALTKSDFSLSEIIQIYYQIINVSSLSKTISQQLDNSDIKQQPMVDKIDEIQKFISDKFDLKLHPIIVKYLDDSIADITKKLQSTESSEKSKDDIESEAKLYDQLRETMSTKEFAGQYQKGLASND